MRALWLEQRSIRVTNRPTPRLAAGEALVRVRLAGICATDLQLLKGYYSFTGIPGHEFVGEIAACEAAPEREGQRVVGEINVSCTECHSCREGRPTHCERREVLGIRGRDGAFAEYLRLPLANLHPVPDDVEDRVAVFTEPLAAALEIQRRMPIRPDEGVLVVGAGRLGQLIARLLRLSGCKLWVVARHRAQRVLLETAGVRCLDEADVPRRHFDRVVEASGSHDGFLLARTAVRPGGTIMLKSTYRGGSEVDLSSLVVDEIGLLGSRCGPFPPALRLLEQGLVDPLPLIDEEFPLHGGAAALARAGEGGVLKVLLRCVDGQGCPPGQSIGGSGLSRCGSRAPHSPNARPSNCSQGSALVSPLMARSVSAQRVSSRRQPTGERCLMARV